MVPVSGSLAVVADMATALETLVSAFVPFFLAVQAELFGASGACPGDPVISSQTTSSHRIAGPRGALSLRAAFLVPVVGPGITFGAASAYVGFALLATLPSDRGVLPAFHAGHGVTVGAGPGILHVSTETVTRVGPREADPDRPPFGYVGFGSESYAVIHCV